MRKIWLGAICCVAGAVALISCSARLQDRDVAGDEGIALGELTVDRCYLYIEAENYREKSGGDLDYKDGAHGKKCLGMRWGEKQSDYVIYDVNLESTLESALLVMRVAIDSRNPQTYEILLDDEILQAAKLDPTGGYGYTEKEWRCYSIPLGPITHGRHVLKIRPSERGGIVNVDCLALGKAR